jgi:hypothetical protein
MTFDYNYYGTRSTPKNLERLLEGLTPTDITRVKHYERELCTIFGRQLETSSRSDRGYRLRQAVVGMLRAAQQEEVSHIRT